MSKRSVGNARVWACATAVVLMGIARAALASDRPGDEASRREAGAILVDKCLACHATGSKKGGLDLTRRASTLLGGKSGPAIVPGKPEESLLFEKVAAGEMPPKIRLRPEQVAAVRAWIESGAGYESEPLAARRAGLDWWSLRPIRRPAVPAVKDVAWVRTPIDAFLLARLEANGLSPAPEADRLAYIRRVTFDLIGLPPTPEEIDAFVADRSDLAHETLVDRLLASPSYGERWARHWLDVARFAESHGYETNQLRPNAWPYRDYVIRAFNEDIPYERFVLEQLAGDVLPGGDWLSRSATGFLVGGAHDVVGNAAPEAALQQRNDDLDDMITATSSAFLGLTVNCARCHDHKFDPIAQRDYYAMQAVFAGVQHADREIPLPESEGRKREAGLLAAELATIDRELDGFEPISRPDLGSAGRPPANSRRNVERIVPVSARAVRFTIQTTSGATEPCLDELEVWTAGPNPRNVALGARPTASSSLAGNKIHRLEHINDGRFGNGRSWISGVPGKGWVQVEWTTDETIDRIVWGRDREEKYRDRTPVDYYVEVASQPGQWRVVASSADRGANPPAGELSTPDHERRDALIKRQKALSDRLKPLLKSGLTVYAGTFTQPGPTYLLKRGDPTQKGEPVLAAGVRAVGPALVLPAESSESDRRLALARWIGHPDNPLPARVMVNRVWHYHFGRGIVATPGDFGFNGEPPSHPELLDWLASEFLANGGRLKPIHRQIVLSSTYRMSSRMEERAVAVDKDDRLLWRFAPRRLEAEEIRDAILSVAGTLDRRMGGRGYSLWEPNTNYVVVFRPLAEPGPETFRRMIYQDKPRSQADPTFGAFDCPDGGLVAPRRTSSTTALQALNLLNSRFMLAQSRSFADRLSLEAGDAPEAQVTRAFQLAFGREPTAVELTAGSGVVREHGMPTLCRALLNANEFLYLP
jgi:mono/diheme cytochrome c family protein